MGRAEDARNRRHSDLFAGNLARSRAHRGTSTRVLDLDNEYMTVRQARPVLRVSRYKMSRLIGEGVLKTKEYMLDRRVKLMRRTDVEKLAASMQRLKNDVAPL